MQFCHDKAPKRQENCIFRELLVVSVIYISQITHCKWSLAVIFTVQRTFQNQWFQRCRFWAILELLGPNLSPKIVSSIFLLVHQVNKAAAAFDFAKIGRSPYFLDCSISLMIYHHYHQEQHHHHFFLNLLDFIFQQYNISKFTNFKTTLFNNNDNIKKNNKDNNDK